MTPQLDFNEVLRRRRLAQMMNQERGVDVSIADEPQPQLPPQDPYQVPSEVKEAIPFNIPGEPVKPTARQQYEQMLSQEPKLADYHPSRARQIGSVIGGILGGIGTRSVGGGIDIGTRIKYGPYEKQQKEFQQKIGPLKAKVESEAAGVKEEEEKGKISEGKARTGAELARTEAEKSRAGAEEERRKQLASPAPELEKKLYDITLKDGNKIRGARFFVPQTGPDAGSGYYVGPGGERYGQGAIQEAIEQSSTAFKTFSKGFQVKLANYVQENGKLPPDEMIDQWMREDAESTGLLGQREAATELSKTRKAQIEALIKPATPQEIETARREQARDPNSYWKYLQSLPPVARRGIEIAVPPQVYLTGGQEDRLGNSNVTLWHVETLRDMLKDPFIKENLGPILGRVNTADSTWGGNDVGKNPEDIQKEQAFLSFLTSNLLWETTSGVGTRPARQTIELIKRTAPRAAETLERISGALDAEEKSARNVQKGLKEGGPEEKKKTPGDFSDDKVVQ